MCGFVDTTDRRSILVASFLGLCHDICFRFHSLLKFVTEVKYSGCDLLSAGNEAEVRAVTSGTGGLRAGTLRTAFLVRSAVSCVPLSSVYLPDSYTVKRIYIFLTTKDTISRF